MTKKLTLWVLLGISPICLVSLVPEPAAAIDPFSAIFRTINNINGTINNVNSTINQVDYTVRNASATVNNLTQLLGIKSRNSGGSVSGNTTTEQVLDIYQTWYKGLSASEQEIVSWLVMEYAKDREVTFPTISSSEWFMQKPLQQQQMVGGLFFKLSEIVKVVSNDKSKFLSFAFCVNSGGPSCNP